MDQQQRRRLGACLRSLRQRRRLTQEELAESTDFHPSHIVKLEAGKVLPSIDAILRLANALEISPGRIIDSIELPTSDDPDVSEIVGRLARLDADRLSLVREFVDLIARYQVTELPR